MSDPYSSSVVLLLHCDDTIGSSTLADAMGYVTQQSGSGVIATDVDAFGGKCLDCTSSYKRLVHPLMYFGFDDYTLEFRFKRSGTQVPVPTLFSNDMTYSGSSANGYIEVSLNHSTYNGVALWWDGAYRCHSGTNVTDTQWHWFAITRQAGTTRLFLDGALVCSTSYAGIVNLHDLDIGYANDGNAKGGLLFDEVRLTRGVARYTGNYTPATQPFSEDAVTPWWGTDEYFDSVVLQLPFESSLTYETTGKSVSVVGTPALTDSFTPFGAHSMSCGSGSYALVGSTGGPTLGANSWTYNVWCQPTSTDLDGGIHETLCVRENGSSFQIGFYNGNLMLWNGSTWTVNPKVKAGQSLHIEVSHDYVTKLIYMFVNGALIYTVSYSSTASSFWAYAARAAAGGDYAGYSQHWYGLIKDLRVTKGVVRHTTSFFPPLAANPTSPTIITGVTKVNGVPTPAKVRCYKRSDGFLVSEVQSAADGTFTVGAYTNQDCYLVALPPDGTTTNAIIFDKMRGT